MLDKALSSRLRRFGCLPWFRWLLHSVLGFNELRRFLRLLGDSFDLEVRGTMGCGVKGHQACLQPEHDSCSAWPYCLAVGSMGTKGKLNPKPQQVSFGFDTSTLTQSKAWPRRPSTPVRRGPKQEGCLHMAYAIRLGFGAYSGLTD